MGVLGPVNRLTTRARRISDRCRGLTYSRLYVVTAIATLIGIALSSNLMAQDKANVEQVKAAFLFQFTHFVEWPEGSFASSDEPLTICIVGNNLIEKELNKIVRAKQAGTRTIRVEGHASDSAFTDCHILFVDESRSKRLATIIEKLRGKPTLTVGDESAFTKKGGVLRLYEKAGRLSIEINTDAAERASLRISSKLLSLAKLVRDE